MFPIDLIAHERKLPIYIVETTLEDLLKIQLEDFFKKEVIVDVCNGEIKAWIIVPLIDSFKFIPIDFKRLPKSFIKRIKRLLPVYLESADMSLKYEYYRRYKHKAIKGKILKVNKEKVKVLLYNEVTAYMLKSHFIPSETLINGEEKWFYVLKITHPLNIYLSRNSKNLPVALLKRAIPWGKFKCIKRIAGVKSIIRSKDKIPRGIIRNISKELNEILIISRRK